MSCNAINGGIITAIIPARGGSKGVPRKNIRNLGGFPLAAYSVAAAHLSERIGRVIVSTDDAEIASIAKAFGGEAPFLRPAAFAADSSGDIDVVRHALEWMQENEGSIPEYIAYLRPTTPLRDPKVVDYAIDMFLGSDSYTSMRSAHPAPESPFKWFRLEGETEFKSLAATLSNDEANQDRRSYPAAYVPDGYIDVFRTDIVMKTGSLLGDRMRAFISPPCTEVDTQEELDYLEFELGKKGSVLQDYLAAHYGNSAGGN